MWWDFEINSKKFRICIAFWDEDFNNSNNRLRDNFFMRISVGILLALAIKQTLGLVCNLCHINSKHVHHILLHGFSQSNQKHNSRLKEILRLAIQILMGFFQLFICLKVSDFKIFKSFMIGIPSSLDFKFQISNVKKSFHSSYGFYLRFSYLPQMQNSAENFQEFPESSNSCDQRSRP